MGGKKKVFIITPIGKPGSDIYKEARGVIDTIVAPVLGEKNFEIHNPMDSTAPGSISKDIIQKIVDDDLVIVNLTGQNPNVMYELALRHASNKPVVILIRSDEIQNIPFDIKDERVIPYDNQLFGLDSIKKTFGDHIDTALAGEFSSPVQEATKKVILQQTTDESISIQEAFEGIQERLDKLEHKIDKPNLKGLTWGDLEENKEQAPAPVIDKVTTTDRSATITVH